MTTDDSAPDDLSKLILGFVLLVRNEFEDRQKTWSVDLSQNEVHEVVGALIARQATLAIEMAESPSIWNGHVAPIMLRAMADVYITTAWILRDPLDRAKKFIHYGLGQAKLQFEHRRAELETREAQEGEHEYIAAAEEWINQQRLIFLTDVNLGSWSGISTRGMAEEAGCLDFYNYVYTPFSACAHSMWHHIALYNLKECRSPLHRLHSVPKLRDAPLDPHYLYLAAKYLRKTFSTFDQFIGVKFEGKSAFDFVCDELSAPKDYATEMPTPDP